MTTLCVQRGKLHLIKQAKREVHTQGLICVLQTTKHIIDVCKPLTAGTSVTLLHCVSINFFMEMIYVCMKYNFFLHTAFNLQEILYICATEQQHV